MSWSRLAATGAALLLAHLSPVLAAPASIPGGAWKSILPTGTARDDVRVLPYRLDRTPVTNADFQKFVGAHPEWRRDRISRVMADSLYL
jgi:formylglycine-generating enzyme required for sulfatase activity